MLRVAEPPQRVRVLVDVEVTNRCNAHCVMCPREKTPAMGDMSLATFRQCVTRALEYGNIFSFAIGGLGEPLLHRQIVDFVAIAADAGLKPAIVTNGALLTASLARQLVKAGLKNLNASIGGYRKATYEKVHRGLHFEEVYRNLLDFLCIAAGRANMNVQICPTVDSLREAADIARFWRAAGAKFCAMFPQTSNRGGVLKGDYSKFLRKASKEHPPMPRGVINIEIMLRPTRREYAIVQQRSAFPCAAKDYAIFISWQGLYHVCCNDYEKRHSIGSVAELTFDEAFRAKGPITPRSCNICANCDLIGRNPQPRGWKFYTLPGLYLAGSLLARLQGPLPHPDLP